MCGNNTLKDTYRLLHFDVVASDGDHLSQMPTIKSLVAGATARNNALIQLYSRDPSHIRYWFNIIQNDAMGATGSAVSHLEHTRYRMLKGAPRLLCELILQRRNNGPSDHKGVVCLDLCRLLIKELRWVFKKGYKAFNLYIEQCWHHLWYRVLVDKDVLMEHYGEEWLPKIKKLKKTDSLGIFNRVPKDSTP